MDIEAIKKDMLSQIGHMNEINKIMPVAGERHVLPLKGRDIYIVYYKSKKENSPLLLGFHGGGFLFGGCAIDDVMWKEVSDKLNVNIASIGYRKSPDYMFPAQLEDAYDSTVYLKQHVQKFGFNPNHISVMGCSAGANISTALCMYAGDKEDIKFKYQILNYPFLDCATNPIDNGFGPLGCVFNELHCKPEETKNPLVSPIFATENQLKKMPETILVTAGEDVLRKAGKEYSEMLLSAGIKVHYSVAENMPHGYFEYGFGNPETGYVDEAVKEKIKDGSIRKSALTTLDYIAEHFK